MLEKKQEERFTIIRILRISVLGWLALLILACDKAEHVIEEDSLPHGSQDTERMGSQHLLQCYMRHNDIILFH